MRYWRQHPRLRAGFAVVLLASQAACSTWSTMQATPAQAVADSRPGRIRVTRTDGSRVTMNQPFLRGDSIFGLADVSSRDGGTFEGRRASGPQAAPADTLGVALADIGVTQRRRGSAGKTILLIGGVAVGALATAVAALALSGGWQFEPLSTGCDEDLEEDCGGGFAR